MKTTVKNLSETRVKLTVVLDKDDLKKARKLAIEELSKEVRVAGFRKGKVPADMAEKYLNPNDIAGKTGDFMYAKSPSHSLHSVPDHERELAGDFAICIRLVIEFRPSASRILNGGQHLGLGQRWGDNRANLVQGGQLGDTVRLG